MVLIRVLFRVFPAALLRGDAAERLGALSTQQPGQERRGGGHLEDAGLLHAAPDLLQDEEPRHMRPAQEGQVRGTGLRRDIHGGNTKHPLYVFFLHFSSKIVLEIEKTTASNCKVVTYQIRSLFDWKLKGL